MLHSVWMSEQHIVDADAYLLWGWLVGRGRGFIAYTPGGGCRLPVPDIMHPYSLAVTSAPFLLAILTVNPFWLF